MWEGFSSAAPDATGRTIGTMPVNRMRNMKLRILIIITAAFFTTAVYALMSDFNGSYQKVPTITDPWCGRSIEIQKIRFNKFRISWELITGERSVVELVGNAEGDTLDFRNRKGENLYGYTYALVGDKNRLVVTLTVPDKKVVCHFIRGQKKPPVN